MKIERVNENQIRCTLNQADLASRQLKISELAYGSEKAKELFRDMMQQASYEVGFEADDIPLMIEAIPISSDCIVLIITKVENPEELDTRFSKFSPLDDGEYDYDDDYSDIETIDDNSVMATILVADKYTDTNFDLKLKLVKNEEGIWQVSEVTNYQDYLTMISNLYRQDINTYLTNTKADLDRNNAQFKQLQSEFIVLAENFKTNPSSSQRALLKSFIDNKIVPTYQDWYNYLQSYQIPTGARHLHELRMESTTYTIQAWKAYAIGIQDNKPKDLAKAERLHRKAMETEQKVTDTINNMPALFMPTVD